MNFYHSGRQLVQLALYISIIVFISLNSSCVNSKKLLYFSTLSNDTLMASNMPPASVIQANDVLGITVSSPNPEASVIFNASMSSTSIPTVSGATGALTNSYGYLVSQEGYINFPMLGGIKAAGLTKEQLKGLITHQLIEKKLLIEPIVSINYMNFKVTVLGEVGKPSVINVPTEKISILEAIGLAGDLTIFAKRSNVLLIREENGQKITRRLDLNSSDLFTSGFYYLKSNDVVYVEPGKTKIASTSRASQWIPIVFGGLSFAVIVVDRLVK